MLELRRRLFFVAVSIFAWSAAAYGVEKTIVGLLLEPAHGQKFIYTSPGGGIDFIVRVCLYVGLVFSVPVIIYQVLRYVQPLIGKHSTRFIMLGSLASGVLGVAGILFGYFFGLPAGLQFLLHQFNDGDITALITIQSYLSFVMIYLAGSSLVFQVPLVLYFINRIKPLRIKTLLKQERWVILLSCVIAAMINPSPRVKDMAILAIPMILCYQIGVAIVWWTNYKNRRPAAVKRLFEQDRALQEEREERLKTVRYVWEQSELAASLAPLPASAPLPPDTLGKKVVPAAVEPAPAKVVVAPPAKAKTTNAAVVPKKPRQARSTDLTRPKAVPAPPAGRSQKYVNDFIVTRRPSHGPRIASI